MRRRTALSRVEVLIALLIIVAAGGLLLAATGRLRESAARVNCQNNLKQICIGVYSYHDSNRRLPPLADQGEGAPTGHGIPSAFALLTPWLEAAPWNYHAGRTAAEYHAHSSAPFPIQYKEGAGTEYGGIGNQPRRLFIDPADTTASNLRDIPMTLPDGTTGHYAAGSYAANGLLPWGSGGLADLSGGTSNTILIAERPQVCRTASGDTVHNLWGVGFYSPHMPAFATLTPLEPPGLWATGQIAPISPFPDERATDRDTRILYRVGRWDADPQSLDLPTPIQFIRDGRVCDPRLPGTPHKGGMPVAMADGSVRVFALDTSPWTFWASCLPARVGVDGK